MSERLLIEAAGLKVSYRDAVALEDISFAVYEGERIAVVGPNGAGKSTLFNTLTGLKALQAGSLSLHPVNGTPLRIAFLPQKPSLDWGFPLTVLDAVTLGLELKLPKREAKQAALDALELVHLGNLRKRRINELSGGQQQRVLIARALAIRADVLLMDEPLVGLDQPSREDVFAVLDTLSQRRIPVLVALHDLNLATERFPRALLLNRRLVADGSPADIFSTENLTRTYGSHLHVVTTDQGSVLVSDTCCGGRH